MLINNAPGEQNVVILFWKTNEVQVCSDTTYTTNNNTAGMGEREKKEIKFHSSFLP
jgi:hypothetical protein